jgi:GNAT superfamily N-acetyltransferase
VIARDAVDSERDYAAYARLFVELGIPDPVPTRDRWDHASTFFLEDDTGAIMAYVLLVAHGAVGAVHNVVVDPVQRGRGVGRLAMREAATRLRRAGCTRWQLNVKADNEPALRLYRAVGLMDAYGSTIHRATRRLLHVLPLPARPATIRSIDPADDPIIEAEFDLPRGTFARSRARHRAAALFLVRADVDQRCVGLLRYVAITRMAIDFCVRDISYASQLVAALCDHVADLDSFRLIIDADPALDSLLVANGTTVEERLIHMRGNIPM